MKIKGNEIRAIIAPLFKELNEEMISTEIDKIERFDRTLKEKEIPERIINQLIEFYRITNGISSIDGFLFHKIDDPLIFEFWSKEESLWLGQNDMDILRYNNGKYHLGCASEINYGKEYIFESLKDLLKKSFHDKD